MKLLSDDEFFGGGSAGGGGNNLLNDDQFMGGGATTAEPVQNRSFIDDMTKKRAAAAPASTGSDEEFVGAAAKPAPQASGGFIDQAKKGFIAGLVDQNPQMVGNAMEAIAELSEPEGAKHAGDIIGGMVPIKPGAKVRPIEEAPQRLRELAEQVKEWGKQGSETRQPNVPSFTSIRTDGLSNMIGDAADYAGYLIGSGVGTSAPSIAAGVAGAAATKSPLGFLASAAGPSYVQNLGDTYGALLENEGVQKAMAEGKITRKQVASIAAEAAVPMAALDAVSLEGVIGLNATGLKQTIVKRLMQRVVTGAITEGTTEGVQQVVQEAALDYAGGDKTLAQQAVSVIDNAIGGALAGGTMSAGASPAAGSLAEGQEPGATPPVSEQNIPQGAAPAESLFGQESADGAPPPSADTAAGGPPPPPAATTPEEIERERPNSPRLTPEDRASPLPNALIDDGKKIFQEALSGPQKPASAEPTPEIAASALPAAPPASAEPVAAPMEPAAVETTPAAAPAAATPEAVPEASAPARALSDREFIDMASAVDDAAHAAATSPQNDLAEPTQAMKEAGNYKVGRARIGGLDISIENPEGSERSGTDSKGKPWSVTMKSHYGYIRGTVGKDKDHIDAFVKPGTTELTDDSPVTVIDQALNSGEEFDEHKIMLGFQDMEDARKGYLANYTKGWRGIGNMRQTTLGEFKTWLKEGDTKRPFSEWEAPASTTEPSFLTSVDRAAFDKAPQANRDVAMQLGSMIDQMRADGKTERADRLQPKLDAILKAIMPSTASAAASSEPVRAGNKAARAVTPEILKSVIDILRAEPTHTFDSAVDEAYHRKLGGKPRPAPAPDEATQPKSETAPASYMFQAEKELPQNYSFGVNEAGELAVRDGKDAIVARSAQQSHASIDWLVGKARDHAKTAKPEPAPKERQRTLKEKVAAKREEAAKADKKAATADAAQPKADKDFTEDDIPAFLKKDRERAALRSKEEPRAKIGADAIQPTDAFKAQAQAVGKRLRAELDRLGLSDIGLRISETLGLMVDGKLYPANGSYFRKLVSVALDADSNPDSVLDHEAIHALRDVGAFGKDEWAILERKSRRDWRDRYEIADAYGDFSDDVQTEEGIAHAYADWRSGRSMDGIIAKVFKKIRSVLQAIGKAFGKDFRSVDDIFASVESGEVGNRPRTVIAADRMSRVMRETPSDERFKLRRDPETAEEGQKTMQGFIARGQPLDRALRLPFQFLGGVDKNGRWNWGLYVTDKAAHIITSAKINPDGRFGWLAGPVEAARAGLLDRYGLSPEYIERDRQRHMDERAITMRGAEVLKTLAEQNVGANEARVLQAILTGEAVTDQDMAHLAAPIRQAIDELGQEAVALGLVSPESFERNRGTYLHRVYAKHESEQNNLQKLVGQIMGRKRKQIIGDELKGRGLFWEVGRDALLRHSDAAQAMRKADTRIGGTESRVDELTTRREALEGELEALGREMAAHLGRRMDVADRATIKKMVGESRTTKPTGFQKGQVREQAVALNRLRDSLEQREAAIDKIEGEIAAARKRIDELSDHLIAQSENLSVTTDSKFVVLDKMVDRDGKQAVAQRVYIPADEQVPERFVGPEWINRGTWEARQIGKNKVTLWRDYSKAERAKMGEILDARYTIGKTYLYMAHDLATGRFYKDIAENEDWSSSVEPSTKWVNAGDFRRLANDRELMWVKVPDTDIPSTGGKKRWGALAGKFVRAEIWRDLNEIEVMNRPSTWRMLLTQWKLNKTSRSPVVHMNNVMSNLMLMDMQDVRMQDLAAGLRSFIAKDRHWQDANAHGVFGADMMTQEIRDKVLKPILDEIEKQGQDGTQESFLSRAGVLGKFADRLWTLAKTADRKMIDLYRVEDDVFRLASYQARIARGETPEHAAAAAREQFLDYDIRAPWVNAARNSLLPFISYTYRAVPLLARAIATRPWKLAKYAMIAYALNALAYAWDDDGDEDKERASLRDEEQGLTWLFTPRMLRMPWRSKDGLPVFLDARRWIPAGDVFDTNQGSSAVPIPAPLQFGGPLMLAFELALNKSGFTGEKITNDLTDNWWDKTSKTGDYLWKAWLPSAAWVPNSWYWTKIGNAINGATDAKGRPYSLPEAVSSSFGIKMKPQDVETGLFWHYKDIKDADQALRAEARTLARQRERGLISQKAFDAGMASLLGKRNLLVERVKELQKAAQRK